MFSLEAVYFNVILFAGDKSNVWDIFSSYYYFLNPAAKRYRLECFLLWLVMLLFVYTLLEHFKFACQKNEFVIAFVLH